jgi:hypothetical protein
MNAVSIAASAASAWRNSAAVSTLGSITKAGARPDAASAARSAWPSEVDNGLMRSPISLRPSGLSARKANSEARALSLSPGATASSRSMQTWSAPVAMALA